MLRQPAAIAVAASRRSRKPRPLHAQRFLSVLFAAVAALAPGCERPDDPRAPKYLPDAQTVIAIVGPSQPDPAWPAVRNAFSRSIAAIPPHRVRAVMPQSDSAAERARCLQLVADSRAAAVCLWGETTLYDPDLLASLAARGVVVVTIGPERVAASVFGTVQVTWGQAAELLAASLPQIAPQSRSAILLHENDQSPDGSQRYARFRAAFSQQRAVQLLASAALTGDHEADQREILETLNRFPNAGVVISLTARPWLHAGRNPLAERANRFAIVGCSPALWPTIAAGRLVAVGPIDGEIGRAAAELVLAGLTRSEPVGQKRVVRCELVSGETLADFRQRYDDAGGEPTASAPRTPLKLPP